MSFDKRRIQEESDKMKKALQPITIKEPRILIYDDEYMDYRVGRLGTLVVLLNHQLRLLVGEITQENIFLLQRHHLNALFLIMKN